jgi:hypothetical protein
MECWRVKSESRRQRKRVRGRGKNGGGETRDEFHADGFYTGTWPRGKPWLMGQTIRHAGLSSSILSSYTGSHSLGLVGSWAMTRAHGCASSKQITSDATSHGRHRIMLEGRDWPTCSVPHAYCGPVGRPAALQLQIDNACASFLLRKAEARPPHKCTRMWDVALGPSNE